MLQEEKGCVQNLENDCTILCGTHNLLHASVHLSVFIVKRLDTFQEVSAYFYVEGKTECILTELQNTPRVKQLNINSLVTDGKNMYALLKFLSLILNDRASGQPVAHK